MLERLTSVADYFRNIPAAFLVAIVTVLGLILFLPEEYAKIVAVDGFRNEYRVYLGPAFLLTLSFCVARVFIFIMQGQAQRKALKARLQSLRNLTPEEKGYLVPYIEGQQNSVYVGMEDGVMSGLRAKGITYLAANMGDMLNGFAFNLQPWAREYLESNPHLLDGHAGYPMTPQQKLYSR
ncbi:superinfection exclusion B family protein [Halomonas denitrificans]|uniref:super-infection exclusion protein B n=1 Tax=Halomonas denitrificans TaxID=370769 RepID=UPI001CD22612|nr:super-infection exclusion protein B [Halomonas denitrificans]MCA0973108.1 superinfection exclusion B family protein [Halomonas denitrificans]